MIIERQIGPCRIFAECAPASFQRAASALAAFEGVAPATSPLQSGTQMRFGWSLLHLVNETNGLRVTEPDFSVWPQQR